MPEHGPSQPPIRPGRRRAGPRAGATIPISESLSAVVERLTPPGEQARPGIAASVFTRWEQAVGPTVAAHAVPVRVEGSTLVVVADQPAWATQLRHLAPELLAKIAAVCGAGAPDRLEVRIRR